LHINNMAKLDRRKYARVQIHNCISYSCLDSKNNLLDPNMGFVRNVSQDGVCIETVCNIKSVYVKLMFIDMQNNHTEMKGKLAYCRKADSGKFKTGIRFKGTEFENLLFVRKLVKSYHYQKGKPQLVNSGTI